MSMFYIEQGLKSILYFQKWMSKNLLLVFKKVAKL